ncbi:MULTISPECIES: lipase family protein [Gordonia]|uniref:Lipase n=1 Tax=Gordonia sputi NBRC 100414 TaxID=1089453 RepID=H5U6F9_9ACTN|nr:MULTISPECIES: lipase family protein [Gordonia]NKY92157.1 hypothetical protein [Gordonia sputi]GAB41317.1 hypothetical protein GOSPT_125_00840 [Gordonia sputi NBRC 100414]
MNRPTVRVRIFVSWLALAIAVAAALTACGSDEQSATTSSGRPPGVPVDVPRAGATGPGTVSWAQTMPVLDRRISAATSLAVRVEYSSTDHDNKPTVVTGGLFVPAGQAPQGGWPIIGFGHATVGVLSECGPTLDSSLRGAADLVYVLLSQGYAVAVSDYQGLGTPGDAEPTHPYLDATTEGHNIIDSVRAMRQMSPSNTSDKWAGFGVSQGGQAAWASNVLAASYGKGLNLVGTVAISPPADISKLSDKAWSSNLTKDQYGLYQWLLLALKHENPSLDLDSYRRGSATTNWTALSQCASRYSQERQQAADALTDADLRPDSATSREELERLLRERGLPKGLPTAPILVMYGGKDTLIDSAWTTAVIGANCSAGADLVVSFQPDRGHADVDPGVAISWLEQQMQGSGSPSGCTNI